MTVDDSDRPSRNLTWRSVIGAMQFLIMVVSFAFSRSVVETILVGLVFVPGWMLLDAKVYRRHWFW